MLKILKIDVPIFSDKEIADTLDSIEFGIDSLLDIEITNLKEINDFKKLAYDLRDCVKKIEDYHTQDSFYVDYIQMFLLLTQNSITLS